MILLQQINLPEGYAQLVRVDLGGKPGNASMQPLMDAARSLGLRQLRVRDEEGNNQIVSLRPDPSGHGQRLLRDSMKRSSAHGICVLTDLNSDEDHRCDYAEGAENLSGFFPNPVRARQF